MGGANIAGLATPPRRNPAGIIPSYMAVFEFSKLKRLILSGKDVKIRQNCKKEAISILFLSTFYNCKLQWDEINSEATFEFVALDSNLQNFSKIYRCMKIRIQLQNIFQLIVQAIFLFVFCSYLSILKNYSFVLSLFHPLFCYVKSLFMSIMYFPTSQCCHYFVIIKKAIVILVLIQMYFIALNTPHFAELVPINRNPNISSLSTKLNNNQLVILSK